MTASRSIANAGEAAGGDPARAARAEAERLRETAWNLVCKRPGAAWAAAILPAMAGRNPARFLAPLALLAVAFALFSILGGGGGEEPATNTQPRATATATPKKGTKRKRKVYVVKPGDTPSGIAEKTGVSLEQLEEANPDLDPQPAGARPADPDPAVRTLRAPALVLVACALARCGPAERPPRCQADVPSAIVIEVSTGTVACATNPTERRSIASTTKLMTALLTLERAKLSDVYTAADYQPAPAESKIGLERVSA